MSSDRVTSPPQLTHVVLDGEFVGAWWRWVASMALRLATVAFAAGVVVGVLVASFFGFGWGMLAMMLVMAVTGISLSVFMTLIPPDFRPMRAALEATFRARGTPREALLLLMKRRPRGPMTALARELTRAGAVFGLRNRAVCLTKPGVLPDIVPFAVPFEARALDECTPGFDELQTAVASGASSAESARHTAAFQLPRWMERNHATWGGNRRIIVLLVLLVPMMARDFGSGLGWFELCVFAAAIVSGFLVPARVLWTRGRQWYVVPGAIIIRHARVFGKTVEITVYDRRTSVIYATAHSRNSWNLIVASVDSAAQTLVSRTEAAFALRAFLSPLTPPDANELGDFR